MTTSALATELLTDMVTADSGIDMMIGIGLNKESDAVFFQYLGEEQKPSALMLPSGKPLTRLSNVRLVGLSVAEDIGQFKSTKINVVLESTQGRRVMLTSGLQTLWSQYLISGLSALQQAYALDTPFTLDTWKGTSSMRPCFAAVRQGGQKMIDLDLTEQLKDAKADRDSERATRIMRDAIEIINAAVTGSDVEPVTVTEEHTTTLPADIDF